ncbi:hypothetical protein ACLOJK_009640 [Asimina triloba]
MVGSFQVLVLLLLGLSCNQAIQFWPGEEEGKLLCLETERQALLKFKQGLKDPGRQLASWVDHGCCKWAGVGCDNETGHVIKLNLRNPYPTTGGISGDLSPSLLDLKRLSHLDLSFNDFRFRRIPEFIGSFKELRYLNLSYALFGGLIPHHLGNLSSLVCLGLHSRDVYPYHLEVDSLDWLSRLSSLEYLDIGGMNLSHLSDDWSHSFNMLPSLLELRLSLCQLNSIPQVAHVNFTSLSLLDFSDNELGPRIPTWIFNLSNLNYLNLEGNKFQYPVPGALSSLRKLRSLDLSRNDIEGDISGLAECLSGCVKESLESLNLAYNQLSGNFPEWLISHKILKSLDLSVNLLQGPIPESLGEHSELRELHLGYNDLNGTLPVSIGQLTELVHLGLSSNLFEGEVSEVHFANLAKLEVFHASSNFLFLNVSSNWAPPTQLRDIDMKSWKLGPPFPEWIRTLKNLLWLDFSNCQISGALPDWFWNFSMKLNVLILSNNEIVGKVPSSLYFETEGTTVDLSSNLFEGLLPSSLSNVSLLDVSNNSFSGPLPSRIFQMDPFLAFLSISSNYVNGTIPISFCSLQNMLVLDLSKNELEGEIPPCLMNLSELFVLDIAYNKLSGYIPSNFASGSLLRWLHLSNNNFSGRIPFSLSQCPDLVTLDLSENGFSGSIPTWIGTGFSSLRILKLRSNAFSGYIPAELSNLSSLQILDLADNNLSGIIPTTFGSFRTMSELPVLRNNLLGFLFGYARISYEEKINVIVKRNELEYTKTLSLVLILDLSSNDLQGEIPKELSLLAGLQGLNLSGNHLTAQIPGNIQCLKQLQSLDLSKNQLSGSIPQGLSLLNFLSSLNLSYNNLSGRIPTGNQLQTLTDPSIYVGNFNLCGPPLTENCPGDATSETPARGGDEEVGDRYEELWFFIAIALGHVVGFVGVLAILTLKKSWRIAYYMFVDDMIDRLWVFTHYMRGK